MNFEQELNEIKALSSRLEDPNEAFSQEELQKAISDLHFKTRRYCELTKPINKPRAILN